MSLRSPSSSPVEPILEAVRRERRRRVRGRADVWRHPRRLRREGEPRDVPRAGLPRGPASNATRRSRSPPSSSTPTPSWLGRRLLVHPEGVEAEQAADSLGSARADAAVTDDARGLLAAGRSATLEYGPDGERRGEGMKVFVWAFAPQPRMIVFGAIDFAAAMAKVGNFLGYHVTVCDARPVFATKHPVPLRRRGGRLVAAQVPRSRGRSRVASTDVRRCVC